jgi:hypothetical protein
VVDQSWAQCWGADLVCGSALWVITKLKLHQHSDSTEHRLSDAVWSPGGLSDPGAIQISKRTTNWSGKRNTQIHSSEIRFPSSFAVVFSSHHQKRQFRRSVHHTSSERILKHSGFWELFANFEVHRLKKCHFAMPIIQIPS